MPCYEAKYFHKNYWEEITDTELMDELYKIYNKITPVIKEMIQGKEVKTADAVYRLKWKGGE
jgi:DNA polymerase sigma